MLRSSLPAVLACLALPALRAQGDIVHYTFDAADSNQVLNHASGAQAAPRFGDATWPASMLYAPGRAGHALHASSFVGVSGYYVRSGWSGAVQGDLTIAFLLKNRLANSVASYSPVAGQPGWSIASGGSAGAGLQLTGWGGPDLNASLPLPLCSMPGWNHFAVVVDAAAGSATWYVNGAVLQATPVAGGANLGGSGELLVGTDHVTWCGGLYDIDEFRLVARAASAAEVAAWAQAPAATAVSFGTGSSLQLDAASVPSLGNAAFAALVTGTQSLVLFAAGQSYAQAGSVALPLDLTAAGAAAGSMLRVAPTAVFAVLPAAGEARLPLPVPSQPALLGFALYLQAFGVDAHDRLTASNALALGLGR